MRSEKLTAKLRSHKRAGAGARCGPDPGGGKLPEGGGGASGGSRGASEGPRRRREAGGVGAGLQRGPMALLEAMCHSSAGSAFKGQPQSPHGACRRHSVLNWALMHGSDH